MEKYISNKIKDDFIQFFDLYIKVKLFYGILKANKAEVTLQGHGVKLKPTYIIERNVSI